MYDKIFRNGMVIDGSGSKRFQADIAITDGSIAAIGTLAKEKAREEFSIDGLAITPGFIDMHSHSDLMVLGEPELRPKVMQGITSELLGQDGIGPAPLPDNEKEIQSWRTYLAGLDGNPPIDWNWRSLDDYLKRIDETPRGCNMLPLLPEGNVRLCVMGMEDRAASEEELQLMEARVDAAMLAGAWGISLGMVYLPCVFSNHAELIRLLSRAAAHGGIFVVHMRNGSTLLLESLDELFDISSKAAIPLHVSHFKAAGKNNWAKMTPALAKMEEQKRAGRDVSFDIYPYTAASTMFTILLPPWSLEGGVGAALERLTDPAVRERIEKSWNHPDAPSMKSKGWDNPIHLNGWDNIYISSARSCNSRIIGKNIRQIAEDRGARPEDVIFQLMREEHGDMSVIYFSMNEDCVAEGIRHELGMICTDGLLGGAPHPRVYGSFPHVLGHFARDRGELALEEAIHKMTGKPAQRLKLNNRGLLRTGFAADIVVFDPKTIGSRATYENPRQYPTGITHVLVNGAHTVKDGVFSGDLGGKVVRHVSSRR